MVGVMIADGNEYLMFAPWISVSPGVFLLLTVLAFNLLGDGAAYGVREEIRFPRGDDARDERDHPAHRPGGG